MDDNNKQEKQTNKKENIRSWILSPAMQNKAARVPPPPQSAAEKQPRSAAFWFICEQWQRFPSAAGGKGPLSPPHPGGSRPPSRHGRALWSSPWEGKAEREEGWWETKKRGKKGRKALGTPPAAAPLSARRALRPVGPAAGTRGPGLRPRPPQPRAAPRSAAAGAPEQWRRRGRRAEGPAGGAATKAGEDGERGGEAAPAGRAYLVELLAHIGVDVDVVHAVRHDPTRDRRQPRPAPEPPPGGGGSGEAERCVTSAAAQRGFRLRRAEGRSSCPARWGRLTARPGRARSGAAPCRAVRVGAAGHRLVCRTQSQRAGCSAAKDRNYRLKHEHRAAPSKRAALGSGAQ